MENLFKLLEFKHKNETKNCTINFDVGELLPKINDLATDYVLQVDRNVTYINCYITCDNVEFKQTIEMKPNSNTENIIFSVQGKNKLPKEYYIKVIKTY